MHGLRQARCRYGVVNLIARQQSIPRTQATARPQEEAPPPYGAWLAMRPILEAREDEEDEDEAIAGPPLSPAPTNVSSPETHDPVLLN
jgi:hypothetical protein